MAETYRGLPFLASQGLRVFRFDDLQVLKEIEGVMEVINPPPNPPFRKGGNGLSLRPRMITKTCVTHD